MIRRWKRSSRGHGVAGLGAVFWLLGTATSGCVSYQQDLQRVRTHYEASELTATLALLRALEPDLDALTAKEQIQYAYFRGMTDFRLAATVPAGQTRVDFQSFAGVYLHRAQSLSEKDHEALSAAQVEHMKGAIEALAANITPGDDLPDQGIDR